MIFDTRSEISDFYIGFALDWNGTTRRKTTPRESQ